MKILYLSVHSILEYEELTLLTELGHECFSLGAYIRPEGHYLLPRPGVKDMISHPEFEKYAIEYPKTHIADELIEWADAIIIMHNPNILMENWDRIKHKKVIWRTIGQSTVHVENMVRKARYERLKVIRMSPQEEKIVGYVGSDALIRFYKDPIEWNNWTGHEKRIINFTQTLLGRRQFCHYDAIMQVMNGFPSMVYGTGNEDLGGLNGGELTYDLQKGAMRDNRVAVYGGTWPSPYSLSIMEYMMTGMPVICLGPKIVQEVVGRDDQWDYYEMDKIIVNNENGFISDNINELRERVHDLLTDDKLAERISQKARETAIEYWGKERIKEEWREFFEKLEKGEI